MLAITFTGFISSQKGNASVIYYEDGLCYHVMIDDNLDETGEVEVFFPESTVGIKDYSYEFDIIVPDHIVIKGETYKVTRVAKNGFQNVLGLLKIVLPDSVKEIGDQAFSGCVNLYEIEAKNDLIEVGRNAFKDTKWLE